MSDIILPPCPHEDCTEPGHHWHEEDGSIRSHSGSTCHDPWSPTNRSGCVDTRHPATPPDPEPEPESSARPVIPEITDEEVEAAFEEAWGPRRDAMRGECRTLMEVYRARLIESLDAWKRLPVGATIPAGVRGRAEYAQSGDAIEMIHGTSRHVSDRYAVFVRASDWDAVTLPEPEPDEGERLVAAVAQRLRDAWGGSHRLLDDLSATARSYWLDTARQVIAGLEDDGFTIEPKPRGEAS